MATKTDHLPNVQGLLTGQGLNVPDAQIYSGPIHEEMDHNCIAMVETGGSPPDDQYDGSESIQYPEIQIRIRHRDRTKGKSDADDVWELVHDARPTSSYGKSNAIGSGPAFLGVDDDGRYEWSVNVELYISE